MLKFSFVFRLPQSMQDTYGKGAVGGRFNGYYNNYSGIYR